jgi:DNA-binding CsgD family transcriptional regulator
LGIAEQKLLRRLAVFVASFSAEAAERVAAGKDLDRYDVLNLLGRLVDKSLVQLDDQTGRYHLLETIRQYGLERCRAAGELEHQRDRHMQWALEFVQAVDHDLCDRSTMATFGTDYANLRAGLEWASERDLDIALHMTAAFATFWGLSGRNRDALSMSTPLLAITRETHPQQWAVVVSRLSWVYVSAGDVDFVTTHVLPALKIARADADLVSQAKCLYGMALASEGDSARFEPVHELGTQGGNLRSSAYGALLAAGSLLGTRDADRYLERAAHVGAGFDDETYELILPAWVGFHRALRGHQPAAAALARQALTHRSRAIAAQLTVVAGIISTALQGGDIDLLDQASHSVPVELRDVPGSQWWIQLLDDAATLMDPDRQASTLAVPQPLMLNLLSADLVMRVLLSDARLTDAEAWADVIPASWPAATCSAHLARAWIAVQRSDPNAGDRIHRALLVAHEEGFVPFATEALELAAIHSAGRGHHELSARLLGAAGRARDEAGILWRYLYHHVAVQQLRQRLDDALGSERSDATINAGAVMTMTEAIELAQSGRRRRPSVTHGWDSLTPAELAVAREIAAGSTNAQAAERLFIAPSTVKTHLERIYTKVGVRGRAALATEVARHH